MTGSDELKLVVMGKSRKPRCFRGIDIDTLPVTYRSIKNAWMTSVLFEEWIRQWDADLARHGRKILLMADNCAAHAHLERLTNIRLKLLPANTICLIQPMDQGIIKNLKTLYRRNWFK